MKISVIIPTLNEEKLLQRCLDSLSHQEEKPDEIIIVNNNSTDNTEKIAKKYNVKIALETEPGIIPTRNKGFNLAIGDIIARCDADTVVPKDWIKKIKKKFTVNTIDALVGPVRYYDLFSTSALPSILFIKFMKLMFGYYPLLGLNMILTKNMWQKVRSQLCIDDKKVHEDIDLALHINKNKGFIEYDPTLIVQSSGRRIKNNPISFFIEYPVRLIQTLSIHRDAKNKQI